ncbi:MAG TPA: 6,7-dimethyl-8-ribityllumazine synthase [Candidatus Kryptonia bacterium]|nr:6,7-dimethyl-8-ribityllumazine synthase [Candidatus Kryptonia bacterium]
MPKVFTGNLDGSGLRFGIAVARFNSVVTERLLAGAIDALRQHGTADADIEVLHVPGAFELPFAAQLLADSGVDGVICLGAIIKGETIHNEVLASGIVVTLSQLSVQHALPVAFGVLTTDTVEQALARAGAKSGNKGAEAALTALEMAQLKRAQA